jgi:hypothetical protein
MVAPPPLLKPTVRNDRTAALQAEIDETVGLMRDNINKVSQRGDRLDSLHDQVDLSVSAQGFRRGSNRVKKQTAWSRALEGVQALGSGLAQGVSGAIEAAGTGLVQGVSGAVEAAGSLVDNGRGLIVGWDDEDEVENLGANVAPKASSERLFDFDEEGEDEDEDVVNRLLSDWTTLPPQSI